MSLPHMDPTKRIHHIYRAYNRDGQLVYAGRTIKLRQRFAEHRKLGVWTQDAVYFRIQGPYNYQTAKYMEDAVLATENPLYGVTPWMRSASPMGCNKNSRRPFIVPGHPPATIVLPARVKERYAS